MANAPLKSEVCYSGCHQNASWYGRTVKDCTQFASFLRQVVRPRMTDADSGFEADLLGLATTGMAADLVGRLLRAIPEPEGWEIGEALAECALRNESDREFHWPWNTVRDKRTPRASLPGADLVGFCAVDGTTWLTIGEVKSSSDAKVPPGVMLGKRGMAWQLDQNVKRHDIICTLLKWLSVRCSNGIYQQMYEESVGRYLNSMGSELLVVGVLIRDTAPSEADLQGRGIALAQKLPSPTRVDLFAWYLPVPIAKWPTLLQEEVS